MSELRLILLIAGVLFIAGIAGFEWWRARRNRPLAALPREESAIDSASARSPSPLPEINVVRERRVSISDALPVIELASTSESGTRRALGISIASEVAVDVAESVSDDEDVPLSAPPAATVPTVRPAAPRNEPYIGQDDEI